MIGVVGPLVRKIDKVHLALYVFLKNKFPEEGLLKKHPGRIPEASPEGFEKMFFFSF